MPLRSPRPGSRCSPALDRTPDATRVSPAWCCSVSGMRLPRLGRDPERAFYALLAGLALVVIYLVAFVVSNDRSVKVSFVFASGSGSLIWVMLICTLLGIVA